MARPNTAIHFTHHILTGKTLHNYLRLIYKNEISKSLNKKRLQK